VTYGVFGSAVGFPAALELSELDGRFGVPIDDPGPATTVIRFPGLPAGIVLTLQGAIVDSGSASRREASATNAVTVVIVP